MLQERLLLLLLVPLYVDDKWDKKDNRCLPSLPYPEVIPPDTPDRKSVDKVGS